jgi:hypothetical protein
MENPQDCGSARYIPRIGNAWQMRRPETSLSAFASGRTKCDEDASLFWRATPPSRAEANPCVIR